MTEPCPSPQVRAMRLSFVGELGWELHIPRESCVPVYRAVMTAGAKHGLVNAGYRAIDSLSIEKGKCRVCTALVAAEACSQGHGCPSLPATIPSSSWYNPPRAHAPGLWVGALEMVLGPQHLHVAGEEAGPGWALEPHSGFPWRLATGSGAGLGPQPGSAPVPPPSGSSAPGGQSEQAGGSGPGRRCSPSEGDGDSGGSATPQGCPAPFKCHPVPLPDGAGHGVPRGPSAPGTQARVSKGNLLELRMPSLPALRLRPGP